MLRCEHCIKEIEIRKAKNKSLENIPFCIEGLYTLRYNEEKVHYSETGLFIIPCKALDAL